MHKDQFEKAFQHLHDDVQSIRTNQANPSLVDSLVIEAYGSKMKLMELASITVPEPQMLTIQPWDKSIIKNIETAIHESKIGLNPVVDGEIIRLSFPQMTEEKRKELVKCMHEKVEEGRVAIRKIREEIIKELKQKEKNGDLSEDEYFRQEKEVQKSVDDYNNKIKDLAERKEKDLLEV